MSSAAKLLFFADEACGVSLDGAPVATEVEPGEHLVSAGPRPGCRRDRRHLCPSSRSLTYAKVPG